LGILSAVKRGTWWDYAGRILALLGQTAPQFWLGIVLIIVFAVWLEILPVFGRGGWEHYILPSLALGWLSAAGLLRLVRSAMLEVLDSEYVKFARAKGVNYQSIIWRHALKNALIAPLTYSALFIAGFIDGSVVIETVFAWPGVGRLTVEAINANDFPLVTAVITLVTILYVTMALIADVLYAVVDPRIRLT
jgi:peptide/nickel transport system permease protein